MEGTKATLRVTKALKKTVCIVGIVSCSMGYVMAQDIAFSTVLSFREWYSPVMVGLIPTKLRGGINYRKQWAHIPVPYTNTEGYFHYKYSAKFTEPGWFGFGLLLRNDQATKHLIRNSVLLNASYIAPVSDMVIIGGGMGVTYNMMHVNINNLLFESQLTSDGFDPSLPNGESIEQSTQSWKINMGLLGGYKSWGDNLYIIALGLYHAISTPENILVDQQTGWYRNMRLSMMFVSNIYIKDNNVIKPIGILNLQGKVYTYSIGGVWIHEFFTWQMNSIAGLGLLYHRSGSFAPNVILGFNLVTFNISYDINLFRPIIYDIGHNGGLEVSVEVTYPPPSLKKKRSIYCPRL